MRPLHYLCSLLLCSLVVQPALAKDKKSKKGDKKEVAAESQPVVGDSSAPVAAETNNTTPNSPPKDPQTFSYKPGRGIALEFSKDLEVRVDGVAQLAASNDPVDGPFFPQRLKFAIRAEYGNSFSSKFAVDFASLVNNNAADNDDGDLLSDAWAAYERNGVSLKAGYFKMAFGREQVISSEALLLPERSQVTKKYGYDRGIGTGISFASKKDRVVAEASLLGDVVLASQLAADIVPVVSGRLTFNVLGKPASEEAAIEIVDKPRLSVAVNAALPFANTNEQGNPTFGADAMLHFRRISLIGEGFARLRQVDDQNQVPTGDNVVQSAAYAQLGLVVVENRVQIGMRGGLIGPDPDVNDKGNTQGAKTEISAVANVFLNKRQLMLQTMAGTFLEAGDDTQQLFLLQVQGAL